VLPGAPHHGRQQQQQGLTAVSTDTIWRWFCSLSEAELHDPGEPILEMRLHAGSSHGFEPVLIEDTNEAGLPELLLP
jgi:hypothetical protein